MKKTMQMACHSTMPIGLMAWYCPILGHLRRSELLTLWCKASLQRQADWQVELIDLMIIISHLFYPAARTAIRFTDQVTMWANQSGLGLGWSLTRFEPMKSGCTFYLDMIYKWNMIQYDDIYHSHLAPPAAQSNITHPVTLRTNRSGLGLGK
jgi:hypothetical protein